MTRYLTIFVIIALGLMGYLTYQFSKEAYRILPIEEEEPAVSFEVYNFQNWHEFSSPNGEFKVLLPTLPQRAVENINDPESNEMRKYDMYVAEKNDGTIFMISLITFPNDRTNNDTEMIMQKMMNDMIAGNPTNELRSVKAGQYKTYDSMDFAYGNEELSVDAKTFMAGNTLYVLSRIVRTQNFNTNEFNFFINSFELSEGE